MGSQSSFKGVIAIVIASFLWGTTGTAAQYAPEINPFAIGAFAMGVAGVLLCLMSRRLLLKDRQVFLANLPIVIYGSLCVAVYPLAFYASMRLSGVAIGTVVSIASAPLFAAFFEYLFGKKKVSFNWVVSFVLGAVGIVLLSTGKSSSVVMLPETEYKQHAGIVLGLVAGVTYAGYSWAAKQLINAGGHSKSAMASLFGCAALLLLPSLYFTGERLFATPINTTVALYMAVVPMFFGYVLFGFGLRFIEVSQATLITLIEPVVATLFAILLIGETFSALGWLGMALVCLCLVIQTIKFPQRFSLSSKLAN